MNDYVLTEQGRKKCEHYIREMKAKRKEILYAGLDTASFELDDTPEDILHDLLYLSDVDDDGDIWSCLAVTDNYCTDRPFSLTFGDDFVKTKENPQ